MDWIDLNCMHVSSCTDALTNQHAHACMHARTQNMHAAVMFSQYSATHINRNYINRYNLMGAPSNIDWCMNANKMHTCINHYACLALSSYIHHNSTYYRVHYHACSCIDGHDQLARHVPIKCMHHSEHYYTFNWNKQLHRAYEKLTFWSVTSKELSPFKYSVFNW